VVINVSLTWATIAIGSSKVKSNIKMPVVQRIASQGRCTHCRQQVVLDSILFCQALQALPPLTVASLPGHLSPGSISAACHRAQTPLQSCTHGTGSGQPTWKRPVKLGRSADAVAGGRYDT